MQNKKQLDTDKHARNDTSNLSLSLLLGMSDIPLYRAAEKLGISTSYLKNICRRLGIARWPRAGRSIGGVSKSNPQAKVNIDYSRRIYRKYSAGAERKLPVQINISGNSEERRDLSLDLHDQLPRADPDIAEQGSSTHSPAWTWDIGWNPQQELSTEQTSWDSWLYSCDHDIEGAFGHAGNDRDWTTWTDDVGPAAAASSGYSFFNGSGTMTEAT